MTREEKMTPEEAIAEISFLKVAVNKVMEQALDMAIQALSQEPTVDVLEQIRAEIEHEGAMFPDGEFFVSIDRINEIIDKYKGDKE